MYPYNKYIYIGRTIDLIRWHKNNLFALSKSLTRACGDELIYGYIRLDAVS